MLIRSYCIGSLKDIELFPFMERVQFTLNSRMAPQKRKTVEAFKKMHFPNTEVYVHYDFLRTVPRYPLMTDYGKQAMVEEMVDIIQYSLINQNVKGIVIHMDTAFKKEMMADLSVNGYSDQLFERAIKKHIISPMYKSGSDCVSIIMSTKPTGDSAFKSMNQEFLHKWYTFAVNEFYNDLLQECVKRNLDLTKPHAIVYLENTTHILTGGFDLENDCVAGSVKHNTMCTVGRQNLLGVCWDLEHAFASGDILMSVDNLVALSAINSNIFIHLNCIEKGVTRGSMRDRHSLTTIFECSKYEPDYYVELVQMLNHYKIPYMREVKSETMEREIQQQKQPNVL